MRSDTRYYNKAWLISCLLLIITTSCREKGGGVNDTAKFVADSTLNNIEEKIRRAFIKTQIQRKITPLTNLQDSLLSGSNHLQIYWRGYLLYNKAIFYLAACKNKESSKRTIKEGINALEDLKNKNSEDYALLGLLMNFYTQFATGMEASIITQKARHNLEKSLQLNKNNLRAYCVIGMQDFNTPEEYGGKQNVEKYLKIAISMPKQTEFRPYLPAWGKNMAYETLIRYYLSKKDSINAKAYLSKALKEFPEDYQLFTLEAELN